MCTYCSTSNYRKIYENHHGAISREPDGRSYEIHHIDGNHNNNDPTNLIAVSIQEHYNIHFSQHDWASALKIGARMKLPHDELSKLASAQNYEKVKKGIHPFSGGKVQQKTSQKRIANGTHNFLGHENPVYKLLKEGTHNFLGDKHPNYTRIKNGTHNFLGSTSNLEKLAKGIHASQIKIGCIFCQTVVSAPMFTRWHGNKCKLKS